MFKNNWIRNLNLLLFVFVISLGIVGYGDVKGQGSDCQQPASVPACSGNDATICSGCSPNQFCCPKTTPGGCNDSFENLCEFTSCISDPDSICQVTAPTPTPTPSPSSSDHTITFINNCSTESIWIAAYNGFGGTQPLLCAPSSSGPTTGDCAPNKQGGVPPPWGNNGSPTWEIPRGKTRSLTVPFCYTSVDFAARTGCTQTGNTLACTGGDCGAELNCGTNNKTVQPATLAEFTFDGGKPNCNDLDNYDVSANAGFNLRVNITPDNTGCETAGGQCTSLDSSVCPYNLVLWNPTTNQWDIRTDKDTDIGTCLAPNQMAANNLQPFTNFTSDEIARLGCNPSPYNISPIQPVGNCFSTFEQGGTCTLSACGLTAPYQFCDPYGECDKATKRTAAWPSFTDPTTNMQQSSTIYIQNIQTACGTNTTGGGIYTWAFDDTDCPCPPAPSGLSGGLFTCPKSAPPIGGQNYTVTFWCDGDTDNDGVTNTLDADSDNDGIPDTDEVPSADEVASNEINSQKSSMSRQTEIPDDPDGDGIPNELDLDSDGDGIPDHFEAGGTNDENRDGTVDNFTDMDLDGHHDLHDENQGGTALPLLHTDHDGIPDFLDEDSDGDGICDVLEAGGIDEDRDCIHDDSEDLNADGLADSVHPRTGEPLHLRDTDGDGIPDHLDASSNTSGSGCSIALAGATPLIPLYLLIPVFILIRRVWERNRS